MSEAAAENLDTTSGNGGGSANADAHNESTANDAAEASSKKDEGKPDQGNEQQTQGEDKAKATESDQADDWRKKMAGDDEKELKFLNRYTSPESFYKAYKELQTKLSSAKIKTELSDNPSEEELSKWRKENNIPEKPEDYKIELPESDLVNEDSKKFVDEFSKKAHELNMNLDQAKQTVDWYYQNLEQQVKERQAKDIELIDEVNSKLEKEWGREFDRNMNLMVGYFDGAQSEVYQALDGARLADGTPVFSDKNLMNFFAERARDFNPVITSLGGGGDNDISNLQTEKAKLQQMIADTGSEYHVGPMSSKHKARYREIIDAEKRLKKNNR